MKVLSVIFFLLFSLVSCGSDELEKELSEGKLECLPTKLDVSAAGGVYSFNVTCNSGEWTAFVDDNCNSWISIKVAGSLNTQGTVTVTVSENTGKEIRNGSVVVKSGTERVTIPIIQELPMQVSESELYSNSIGETFSLAVTATQDWKVKSDDSWLRVEKMDDKTLSVTTALNDAKTSRTGTVEITSGAEKVLITVIQESAEDREILAPEGYRLIWHDEFNDGSTLGSDWTHEVQKSGWVNNELQNYVNGEVGGKRVTELADGKLSINCFKGSDGKIYSGRVYAKVNTGWKYGYFEARILLPKGKGTWPAFWMMPVGNDWNTNPWPMCGEIDIMEEVGVVPNEVSSSIHTQDYNHTKGTQKTHAMTIDRAEGEFHVYVLEWTEDAITTYVDGKVQLAVTKQQLGSGHNQWPFHYAFYPILNLAWGGDWGGMNGVDESALPVTMKVDYLRVFQKE